MVTILEKTTWRYLPNIKLNLPWDPSIPLLEINSADTLPHAQKDE